MGIQFDVLKSYLGLQKVQGQQLEKKINEHYAVKNLMLKELRSENQQLEQKIIELYNLFNITKNLNLSVSLNELFDPLLKAFAPSLKIDQYCLLLFDEEQQVLKIRDFYGLYENREPVKEISLKPGKKISGKVFQTGEPILIQNANLNNDIFCSKGCTQNIGSLLSLPLVCKKKVIGVWNIYKTKKHNFEKEDVKVLSLVAEHLAITINRTNIYDHIKELSIKDDLTQLHNRRYFFDFSKKELELSIRYNRTFSIILIDIDYFKKYNDINGHIQGDEALKQTAEILQNQVRKGDLLARLGGDEFVILLPETNTSSAFVLAEKLRKRLAQTHFKGEENQPGKKLTITSGIASYPANGDDTIKIIKSADKKMYLGKTRGRNKVCT